MYLQIAPTNAKIAQFLVKTNKNSCYFESFPMIIPIRWMERTKTIRSIFLRRGGVLILDF